MALTSTACAVILLFLLTLLFSEWEIQDVYGTRSGEEVRPRQVFHDHSSDNVFYNPSTGNMLSRHNVERSEVYPSEWKWPRRPEMVAIDPIPSAINNPTPIDVTNNHNMTSVPVETISNN